MQARRTGWQCVFFHVICFLILKSRTQTLLIDPGQFRVMNEILQEVKGKGRIETLTFAATANT